VRRRTRLSLLATACAMAAGLWTGLEFYAGLNLAGASLVGVGLLSALGALWPLLSDGSSPSAQNASSAEEGSTLKGVMPAFAGRDKQWADIKAHGAWPAAAPRDMRGCHDSWDAGRGKVRVRCLRRS